MEHDNTFHSRLSSPPDKRYIEELRKPEFEILREEFFNPVLSLNEAHVIMLEEQGIIATNTAADVIEVMRELRQDGSDDAVDGEDFSDIYFHIEDVLINKIGDERGGVLQTARSRNDLYDAAIRIVVREIILSILEPLNDLRETVLDCAADNRQVITTSYTHSQPGQPITLAHYFLSFDHLLERDARRLQHSFNAANESPLGSAVTGGTGFNINRERLADLTGFPDLCYNTYDATASMDYIPQSTSNSALLMANISRVARDLIDWSTVEYDYIEISDGFSSVSSIMPQKKNPYPLEKLRTSASDSIGAATSSLTHLKGAPYGDVSEVAKYAFVPLLRNGEEISRMVRLLDGVIDTMEVKEDNMLENTKKNFSTMTELADTLVRQEDASFRQAHQIVGTVVKRAIQDGRTADEISLSDLNVAANRVLERDISLTEEELNLALDPRENVERRNVVGGTAPECNQKDLERQHSSLDEDRSWFTEKTQHIADSQQKRQKASNRIINESL